MSNTPTVVIVPGAWHCPKHYKHLINGLTKLNYEVIAVTLPSVNSNPLHTTWEQDAQAVRQVIMESINGGKDVIAIAHSFGGIPMSEGVKGLGKEVREKQGLKGGVVRLMYMCAMALPEGQTHVGQVQPQTPEEEELERQRQELAANYGGMKFTEDGAMLLDGDVVRDVFYHDCDPKDVDEAVELLGTFPPGPLSVPATYAAYREIPSTYIVCENDRALALSYQERMIAQGEGAFQIEAAVIFRCHIHNTAAPNALTDSARTAESENGTFTSLLLRRPDLVENPALNNIQNIIGSSPSSPIYLLNSKLNATILDGCLARIYNTIVTSCTSRYIDYDCNLYATKRRYELENDECGSPQEQLSANSSLVSNDNLPKTPSSISQSATSFSTPSHLPGQLHPITQDFNQRMTVLGAVRFLDHLSDLYGNRLTGPARRKSDAVLKAVLRAFSLQWISPTGPSSDTRLANNDSSLYTTCDSSVNAFYDSWFRARTLIRDSLSVRSFRVACAILMFDGISIPTQARDKSVIAHEFIEAGLQKLDCLTGLVEQYCANLGPHSMYGAIAEASLSIIRWCGHIRDIGAALTGEHVCRIPDSSGHEKGDGSSSGNEPALTWSHNEDVNPDFDDSVPGICRATVAEAFRVWRHIVALKASVSTADKDDFELCPNVSAAIASTVTAVGKFNQRFRPFLNHCVENIKHLSIRSRLSSVSITMFWNLGIFVLSQTLKPIITGLSPICSHDQISTLQAYNTEATYSVAQTVERVLSLPLEEIFNLHNGVSAESSILSYHITPSLMATTLKKAIENILDTQFYPLCSLDPTGYGFRIPDPDAAWKQQIDIIMKGLVSLEVTIGGLQDASVAIQELMRNHGDVISECWSSDFET
ncbi:Alpha/beta hydrolase family-domain-containing protein [Aspergillus alliaceus]|uniref:Alpha/beta hydrolase family-domain-containing protein n=1 Tax=Petromyces alliaceus TaxID=209559 RepID=A0A5N7CFD7_PETAA|nr:Alpha/beta hydrolase family-domain-containing protein [Aspergillus alliaceus]